MNLRARTVESDEDKLRMAALSGRYPESHLRLADLPYRLSSWSLDNPENTRLWFDETGELAAWAVMQLPFWNIDYSFDPARCESLLPLVLDWATERAGVLAGPPVERPCWFVSVFADCADEIRIVEAAGFRGQADVGENSWSKVWMERLGSLPLRDYRIPAGYIIRPLAGEGEVPGYVALHQAVFESKNMTEGWRRRTLQHPAYTPDLDLVVEAPDGRLAAFCIGWLHQRGGVLTGQIEPLGCHKDYRHLALGRLALTEALRRMADKGVAAVNVETDNYRDTAMRMYESMGFVVERDVLIFRKDQE